MTPVRSVRVFLCLLILAALPAMAGTTELRVFFDTDSNATTGCTVGAMAGTEQVLVTQVSDDDTTPRVTRTHRLVCTNGVLGAPTDVVTTGWPAIWRGADRQLTFETRIPFSAFGSGTPGAMRVGFDATRGAAVHTALVNEDGTPAIIPATARRRAVGPGPERQIVMDGLLSDWGTIAPVLFGIQDGGSQALRLVRVLTFASTTDNFLYIAASARLASGAPFADEDTFQRQPGQSVAIPAPGVLRNDADPNGLPLTALKISEPRKGTVTLNPDGSFTYTPNNPASEGTDQFEYKATTGNDDSNVARVRITVATGENPGQSPVDDDYETNEDTTLTVPAPGVLDNDPPGNAGTATLVTPPQHGTVNLNANGGFVYKPAKNFFGTDTFEYSVSVGNSPLGGNALVTIVVAPVNDAPSFNAGGNVSVPATAVPYSQTWATNISAGPSNESGQSVNFIVTNDNNALFSVQPSISSNGTLTFTPAGTSLGTATVSVRLRDNGGTANGGDNESGTVTFTITLTCGNITVIAPATNSGTAGTPFSQTFTRSGGIGVVTFATTSTLPAGLTLAPNGVLSGTPTQTGTFPIVVTATDAQGCTGTSNTYTLVIGCPTVTVTNPATSSGTVGSAFSQTFTQSGGVGGAAFALASGTLPAGLTLAANGTLAGTPTQFGTFPITVTATDANGCSGTGGTYTLVIGCQPITVNNPANANGTAGSAFSETFTQSGANGTPTFSIASGTLPAGLTLAANGVLSGTPTQTGSFPITVRVTDANGCTGTGATYTLVIGCQTITVTNPASGNGTAGSAFSQTFTQSGGIGTVTYTLASGTLPAGLTLAPNGTLSGTPTQTGSFPITVTATDANGCSGTSATYTIVIGCQSITVNTPPTTGGTAGAPFSTSFSQSGAIGAPVFTTSSTLPAGLTLAPNGTLSGTPTQTGSFPIVVTVTDANGCTGTSATYTLGIGCQVITVTKPSNATGTVAASFSATFTQSSAIGGATFSLASGVLPAGLTLASNGVLSGTPTQSGAFPITVTVTDGNGCTGTSDTYTLVINCQTITVTNPANATGPAGSPFSETFTQSGAIGSATFTLASGTLPAGMTLASNGVLSGTPTQNGSFPITVTVTDANGCTGTSGTYTLTITCQTITVNNPSNANGTANSAFSETFTQSGALGSATFSLASGTLPAGLTLAANGVLSGTPTQTGSFPITVTVTDANGCTGTSGTYTLVIGCQTITVNNPSNANGTANSAFSETFTQSGAIGTATFTLASGTLPTGMTLASNGVLSGTPTQTGSFPITVTVTDANGCTGTSGTYTLVIACQTITVNTPANANGTAGSAFSETFTQTGGIGTITYTLASGTLPAGMTLASNGVLSGTPTQTGSFPVTVTATDANGCSGTSATYTIVIGCQTVTVSNPANSSGTAGSAFSETFTQSGAIGTVTFSIVSGTLPSGMTLAPNGVLSGTPTQTGNFPIVVRATDANGCFDDGVSYPLAIGCQTITVTNPTNATGPAGSAFSETFTQSGGIGSATFTLASGTLPSGLTLAPNGVLSGTPTQGGSFPITVTATDANGCSGTGSTYTIVITCPTITVTKPANANGTAGSPFNETFTQSGGQGSVTYTLASGTLPAGLTLAPNGTLSGTPTQTGSFPITVTVTDANGCTGTSSTYTIVIACQTITVSNPANGNGTANSAFSESFGQSGGIGTVTYALATGTLPAGLTLAPNGTLSGTPTQTGSFPITVTATDANGCSGTGGTYTIVIGCQTITVTKPTNTAGTINAPFSETFTQSGAIGSATFTTSSTLPNGITLAANGVLSGTPTQTGSFPIVVTVTDANGCTGASSTYTLVIGCQTITVTNPSNANGTVGTLFSETFTQSGANGSATFTTSSTLPAGITLSSAGVLSGTPTQAGNFPITVTVTDANGCTGTSSTYTLVIACQTITVTNPTNAGGTVGSAFSETFTQSGGIGTVTYSTASALPAGITLNGATGVLSGTPTEDGTFPIVVTVTDSNGCTGTSSTYNLTIACQVITVNNPANSAGTVDSPFSETFTNTGAIGTATYTLASGTLPSGLTLAANGVLSGTPGQPGSFPITVTVTDANGCTGTSATYTLVIACQTITVTNPATSTATYNQAFSQTFTQTGVGTHTPAVWSVTGTLPPGITLNTSTGVLSGTPTETGTFPVTVTVTDVNGCSGTGATYNLAVAPVATNDSFSNGVNNTQYVLTGGTTATPSTPSIQVAGSIESNDFPSAAAVTVVAETKATTNGGSVTIAADGTFLYTAPAQPGVAPPPSDTFTYTITSNTAGTGSVTSAPATVTINLANRVWYVRNNAPAGGNGQSHAPFNTLAAAQTASTASDIIYVYVGDGTTTNQNSGFVMKNNQKLYGQGIALVVNSQTLVAAGAQPQIGNSGGAGVSITNLTGIEVQGLNIGGSTDAINALLSVASTVTLEVANNTIRSAGNEGIDVDASAGVYHVSIHDNSATATGTAIDVAESASGQIIITAFDDNTISGTTGGTGIAVTGATFDATAGNPINTVFAGAINVGASGAGNGAGTNGIVLTNVSGDLSFNNLNVFADNGTALFVTGSSSTFNAATGLGFRLTANSVAPVLAATNGPAVNISTANINLTPSSITSTGSPTFGLTFSDVSGAFTSGGSISGIGAAATAYRITGSSVNATYNGTISVTQGTGVSLTTNTGTYAFTGALTLSTGSSNAFVATSSGTVTSTNAGSDLTTTTGTAVNISSTTIGASGVQFRSINSATATANPVIVLSSTGAGAFSVTGTGTTAGTGGTIDNKTADAITLSNTGGLVTLKNMIIEDIGSTAGAFNTVSGHDAIHGENVNGGMLLDNMTIRRISDNAINGSAITGGGNTVWNGLTITNSTIQMTNRFHVAGTGDGNNEGVVRILGIRGAVVINNSTLEDGAEMLDFFVTGGTLTLTATASNFNRAYKEFTSGGLASVGGHCIDVTNLGSANVTIGDIASVAAGNDFLNCRLGSVRVVNDTGSTGSVSAVIGRNNFVVNDHSSGTGGDFDFPMGGVLVWSLAAGTTDARITGNYFDETTRASGALGSIGVLADLGTVQARIDGNTFDTLGDGTWVTRSKNGANARVKVDGNIYINGTFVCPDPSCAGGYQGPALYQLAEAQEGGTLHLTNGNETYSRHDNSFYPGNSLETRVNNVGAAATMCVALSNLGAPNGYALEQYAGTYNLFRGASAASGTCTSGTCPGVLAANNVLGGVVAGTPTPTKNPPDVTVVGAINLQTTACQQPSGSIF